MREAYMVRYSRQLRRGLAWLEILLALAILILLLQLSSGFRRAIDVSQWSRTTWMVFNVGIILALIVMRVGPGFMSDFAEQRRQKADARAQANKAQARKEQREAMERMKESLHRRKF